MCEKLFINMRSSKGSRRERELLELLSGMGFVVHRVAGSGSKEEAICDLVAIKSKEAVDELVHPDLRNGKIHFIECKSRKKCFYSGDCLDQLRNLVEHAKKCGAKPVLAVKLNFKEWQFFDLRKGIPEKVD